MIRDSAIRYRKLAFVSEDVASTETLLKQHILEKENLIKLINFTSSEGEEIIQRLRLNVSYNYNYNTLSYLSSNR